MSYENNPGNEELKIKQYELTADNPELAIDGRDADIIDNNGCIAELTLGESENGKLWLYIDQLEDGNKELIVLNGNSKADADRFFSTSANPGEVVRAHFAFIKPGQETHIGRTAENLGRRLGLSKDETISRDHMSILLTEEGYVIFRDHSLNGTSVAVGEHTRRVVLNAQQEMGRLAVEPPVIER